MISTINKDTPLSKVWNKVRKFAGKARHYKPPVIKTETGHTSNNKEAAEALAKQYYEISKKTEIRNQNTRHVNTRNVTNPTSENLEYNEDFTEIELNTVIDQLNSSAPGEDQILNNMIKKANPSLKKYLLKLYNKIWNSGTFPEKWAKGIKIPILKEGKDPTKAESYRPITLLSCTFKTMEKLVSNRLKHVLEKQNSYPREQSGFRTGRSTYDPLLQLDHEVQEAFAGNKKTVVVYFDIEKAYDTARPELIKEEIDNQNIKGHMARFLENTMKDIKFKVRVGNTHSQERKQEKGVQQGGINSVILFSLLMNTIAKIIPKGVKFTLYADDLAIYCSARRLNLAQRKIQLAINRINEWSKSAGLKLSSSKTSSMIFYKRKPRNETLDLHLMLDNNVIPVKDEQKFLGMLWDSRLTWVPHLRNLKERCKKTLNVMAFLSSRKYGADRGMLETLYGALIQPKLDYGCAIYTRASKAALKMLEPIQNQAMRLITGAFRSSPTVSLNVESDILPLWLHREEETAKVFVRTVRNPTSPSSDLIKENWTKENTNWMQIKLIREHFFENQNLMPNVLEIDPEHIAPWRFKKLNICDDLKIIDKTKNPNSLIKHQFKVHQQKHANELQIYTDGSKMTDEVGAACVVYKGATLEKTIKRKLTKYASIFTAEAYAIIDAISAFNKRAEKSVTIYSDSRSVIIALKNVKHKNPLVTKIQKQLYKTKSDENITICWIPSHCGIMGNESADQAAKDATRGLEIDYALKIPHIDFNAHLKKVSKERWQIEWNSWTNPIKLREVKGETKKWSTSYNKNRYRETVLARLRVGHTNITHVHLMERKEPPICNICNEQITVKHLLLNCRKYRRERDKYFPEMGNIRTENERLKHILGDSSEIINKLFKFLNDTELHKVI